jgi:hypothetical protein
MKTLRLRLVVLLAPLMMLAIVLASCGGGGDKSSKGGGGDGSSSKTDGGDKANVAGGGKRQPIEGKGRGTLKGQIVFDGTPPDMTDANAEMLTKQKTKPECLAGASDAEKAALGWVVNPKNKGVKNVFVWLAPGDNAYFKLSDADKKPAKATVEIDQPHCAFEPHCAVAFTTFFDGTKQVPTGQTVIFKNGSKNIAHNTNFKLSKGGGNNITLQPGETLVAKEINKPDDVSVECNIHTWMRAHIRNFEHPFATVTDEDGNYEIKNVPTGVPVRLITFHEEAKFGEGGNKGKEVTLKEGDNTEDFKIKK